MTERFQHSTILCLTAIAQHHGLQINPERVIDQYALNPEEVKSAMLLRIASDIGLKAKQKKLSWNALISQKGVFPLIARLVDDRSVIVVGSQPEEGKVAILDPTSGQGSVVAMERAEFSRTWKGEVVFLKRHVVTSTGEQAFGLKWFIPEIMKQKAAFRDIALTVFVMQLLTLATPIFFQMVIDKVLIHHSASTLKVLGFGILAAIIFETIFGYIRQYITVAATSKIDLRLTRRTFAKLLSLPIDFFERTTAGVITRHIQQLEGIRDFLTGQMFFMVLEISSLFMFIPLLFLYSAKLTMVVIAFTLLISAVIMSMLPTFRRKIDELYTVDAKRQSILLETVHGMRTVKVLAIEPNIQRNWEQVSAESISQNFNLTKLFLAGSSVTGLLGKLMPITIIVLGTQDVFDGAMTVGSLIGFQMVAGRVSGPLLQIVSLINQYQHVAISVEKLGEVMNHPSEGRAGSGDLRPQLVGKISFDNVTFRYPNSTVAALDRTCFDIPAGHVVGIVGRSGSGKTTLTKVIQGLYNVQEGIIRFDGIDAREIDLSHLRRQIGVVLQENFLFRGTIIENIRVTKPDATFEEIVEAVQAAGADEFIDRFPNKYDTFLEEGATNLSGGQKQRLSIARALLAKPNILILDEAASALDPESEAIFIRNLSRIAIGRTVLMVSHRLSTLVNSDAIMVMHRGRLMDSGTHEELLTRCETYQHLWNQQTSHI